MSCLNFEYMLVGQVLLDEASCCNSSFRPPSPRNTRSPSYHPPPFSHSSLLTPLNMFCNDTLPFYHTDAYTFGLPPPSPSPSPRTMERVLYPIYEVDEEGKDDEDEDEDEDDEGLISAFNVPFLRFFKSCLVQFAYMMPTDKSLKSPPQSPRKRV